MMALVEKIAPDNMVDRAAMLLSTDWFAPYWTVIGIEAESQKQCFQEGCRKIVRRIIGDARDYYFIDFSEDRFEQTRDDLRLLVQTCKLEKADAIRIEELAANKTGRDQLHKTAWLFRNVHEELLRDGELDEQIKAAVTTSRNTFSSARQLNLEGECLGSTTTWDRYIRSLTPGHPATLAYTVSIDLLATAELTDVLKQLTNVQREQLHARFRVAAKSLTGVERDRDWSGAEP